MKEWSRLWQEAFCRYEQLCTGPRRQRLILGSGSAQGSTTGRAKGSIHSHLTSWSALKEGGGARARGASTTPQTTWSGSGRRDPDHDRPHPHRCRRARRSRGRRRPCPRRGGAPADLRRSRLVAERRRGARREPVADRGGLADGIGGAAIPAPVTKGSLGRPAVHRLDAAPSPEPVPDSEDVGNVDPAVLHGQKDSKIF